MRLTNILESWSGIMIVMPTSCRCYLFSPEVKCMYLIFPMIVSFIRILEISVTVFGLKRCRLLIFFCRILGKANWKDVSDLCIPLHKKINVTGNIFLFILFIYLFLFYWNIFTLRGSITISIFFLDALCLWYVVIVIQRSSSAGFFRSAWLCQQS